MIAGVLHLPKNGKNAQETLATWTDPVVGVAMLTLGGYVLLGLLVA